MRLCESHRFTIFGGAKYIPFHYNQIPNFDGNL